MEDTINKLWNEAVSLTQSAIGLLQHLVDAETAVIKGLQATLEALKRPS